MPGMNDKLLAEYMVGRCRQGFDYISMYLAATLFERLISSKLKLKNPAKFGEITKDPKQSFKDIVNAIGHQMKCPVGSNEQIAVKDVFWWHTFFKKDGRGIETEREAHSKLHDFKNLRNDIIHEVNPENLLQEREREIMDLMLYVASEYSPKLFRETLSKIPTRDIIGLRNVLNGATADYLVRSVDEVMINRFDKQDGVVRKSWKIQDNDFSNLFDLRKKLVPLKNSLDQWLENKYPTLSTTILTTIDTSSAYIWLPIISSENCSKDVERPNLQTVTASILVTPLSLRFYIDFGGLCLSDRKKYFKFIREPDGEFKKFLIQLNDSDRENFSIFDVEWYSFICKTRSVDSILNGWEAWEKTVKEADRELDSLSKDPIITKNRLLSGFVFDRDWINKNSPLKEAFFLEKLGQIINLYYKLLL